MKKLKIIICVTLMSILVSTSFAFAEGLKLEGSYPENGQKDLQPVNVAVKLKFNETMVSKDAQKVNKGKIKLVDKKGKNIKIIQIYSKKYPKEVWIYVQKDLKSKAEYNLIISPNLKSASGKTLGKESKVNFGIMNMEKSTNIYIIMMVVMVLFMVVFTSWETKRKAKKEAAEAGKKGKVNPYKVAKETGKSVEAIVSEDRAQKEKVAAKKNKQKKKAEIEKAEIKEAKARKHEEERRRAEEIKRQNEKKAEEAKASKRRRKKQSEKEKIFISETKKVGKPRIAKYKK